MGDAKIVTPIDRVAYILTCGIIEWAKYCITNWPLVLTYLVDIPPLNINQATDDHLYPLRSIKLVNIVLLKNLYLVTTDYLWILLLPNQYHQSCFGSFQGDQEKRCPNIRYNVEPKWPHTCIREKPVYLLSLYMEYNKSTNDVVFSWIRNKIFRQFSFNGKNSAERYLGLAYYME